MENEQKTLNVLGIEYLIEPVDVIDRDNFKLGQIDYVEQTIKIDSHLSLEQSKIVMMHEAIHAIFQQLGFLEENENENAIQSLAMGLYRVFNDNKAIFYS